MRMEEAPFTLDEVSWELVVPNLSEDGRGVRRVIVGVRLRAVSRAGPLTAILTIAAGIVLNRHGQGGKRTAAYEQGQREVIESWQAAEIGRRCNCGLYSLIVTQRTAKFDTPSKAAGALETGRDGKDQPQQCRDGKYMPEVSEKK